MKYLDFFKPERKYSRFFAKTTYATILLSMLALFSWGNIYDEINKLNLECQAGNKQACAKLAEIAKNDEASIVRQAAVEKLLEPTLLATIAKNDLHEEVRKAAVKRLTDQVLLADIATNDKNCNVRESAVWKLTDQIILADIAENDESLIACHAAVKSLTDQTLLAAIARNDESWEKRQTKVRKLNPRDPHAGVVGEMPVITADYTWQDHVAEVERREAEAKNIQVRKTAIERLTNQRILIEIAEDAKAGSLRKIAVLKLTDQVVLGNIAKFDKDGYVRLAAAERLDNKSLAQIVYEDLAQNGERLDVRISAIKKLTDQALLANIVNCDKNGEVRIAAILNPHLSDQILLKEIAKNNNDIWAYRGAIEKLNDQALLADVAKNSFSIDARVHAVLKLTDHALLANLAKNDIEGHVREAAEKRIKELGMSSDY